MTLIVTKESSGILLSQTLMSKRCRVGSDQETCNGHHTIAAAAPFVRWCANLNYCSRTSGLGAQADLVAGARVHTKCRVAGSKCTGEIASGNQSRESAAALERNSCATRVEGIASLM